MCAALQIGVNSQKAVNRRPLAGRPRHGLCRCRPSLLGEVVLHFTATLGILGRATAQSGWGLKIRTIRPATRPARMIVAFTVIAACGISPARPKIDRAILGQRPGYGPAATSEIPNLAAMDRLIWMPGLDDGWDPQGLAVGRGSLFVSAYQSPGRGKSGALAGCFASIPRPGRRPGISTCRRPAVTPAASPMRATASCSSSTPIPCSRSISTAPLTGQACCEIPAFPLGRGLKGAFAASGHGAIWIGDYQEDRPAENLQIQSRRSSKRCKTVPR